MSDGGAILIQHSTLTMVGCQFTGNKATNGGAMSAILVVIFSFGNYFSGNKAKENGGAIYKQEGLLTLFETLGNAFVYNAANTGGAIHCHSCNFSIMRGCLKHTTFSTYHSTCATNFYNNTSIGDGGAICLTGYQASLVLNGTAIIFADNSAGKRGGAIMAEKSNFLLNVMDILFIRNSANSTGGAIHIEECRDVRLNGTNVEFKENVAFSGGAILTATDNLTISRPVNFTNNTATKHGGAIAIVPNFLQDTEILITGNFFHNSGEYGGAIHIASQFVFDSQYHNITLVNILAVGNSGSAFFLEASITFKGVTRITHNTGVLGGGIYANGVNIQFSEHAVFSENTATSDGGAIYSVKGILSFNGYTLFNSNTADGNGGALYGADTDITLDNTVNFTANLAQNGGAMFLTSSSTLTLYQYMALTTFHNNASLYGGSIYHEDQPTSYVCENPQLGIDENYPVCFLRLHGYQGLVINSYFDSAVKGGSFLHGGLLDKCRLEVNGKFNYSIIPYNFLSNRIFNITSYHSNIPEITSQPYRICFCESTHSTCHHSKIVKISRGQKFLLSIQAIAQKDTSIAGEITAQTGVYARIHLNQVIQNVSNKCTNLTYNFYSSLDRDELRLTTQGSCGSSGTIQAIISVVLFPCPHPFIQSNEECVCDKRLAKYSNVHCTIDEYNNSYVNKESGTDFWMSASYNNGSYDGLILYKTCPAEYCQAEAVAVSLDNLDVQCGQNREGLLCGECISNYSLMFGSSRCQDCSNTYLLLLLPFAVAGIALVAFLSILRLTVATGMINSIILYANIVQVNKHLIFPIETRNVLTVSIAWLNLDLGFETCFYNGMTAYAQIWLQFVFPLYVWTLIAFIILSSRYSITVSKLIGHNPIAVLATLLLMSYTKVLKIIIEVYSSVDLEYPNNKTVTVWLKDANVPYLQSWHLFLTVMTTLILVCLFLPYTLFLFLGYKLYRFTGRKPFHWLIRIKPLLESYYAPYTVHTRYWTGFLLLIRGSLYLIFSFYSLENTSISLLAINIVFTGLVALHLVGLLCFSHRLYSKLHNNIIELSIYLNLVVISAASLAQINHQKTLVFSLVGLVFATLLGTVLYHFHIIHIAKLQVWLQFKERVLACKEKLYATKITSAPSPPVDAIIPSHDPHKNVTHSEIELREPLL
jgi:predicted outer membrane repeat protein